MFVLSLAIVAPMTLGFLQRTSAPAAAASSVTAKTVAAANDFLATLSDAERAKGQLRLQQQPAHRLVQPAQSGIFQRNGLRFGDLTPRQREAALALVAAALSRDGYQKVTDIMNGDEVLKNAGGGRTGGRQGGREAAAGARRRRSLRTGRVLHRAARRAVDDRAVDDSVRRASSRHQRHGRRTEQRA